MRDILNRMPVIQSKQEQPRVNRANVAKEHVPLSNFTSNAPAARPSLSKRLPRSNDLFCPHCQRPGHLAKTCCDLHPEQAPWAKSASKTQARNRNNDLHVPPSDLFPICAATVLPDRTNLACTKTTKSSSTEIRPSDWISDSGCGAHSTPTAVDKPHLSSAFLRMANGNVVPATSIGSTLVPIDNATLELSNVRHVPSLDASLISVGKLVREGWKFTQQDIERRHGIIFESPDRSQIMTAQLTNEDIYVIRLVTVPQPVFTVRKGNVEPVSKAPIYVQNQSHSSPPLRQDTLHRQWGHASSRSLVRLAANPCSCMKISGPKILPLCDVCQRPKQVSRPFSSSPRVTRPATRIFLDIVRG